MAFSLLYFMEDELPTISCLMVTAAGRLESFVRSLRCYNDQTYPNRELIIVNEGPPTYQEALDDTVRRLERDDIHTVWLRGHYSLGSLRNISVSLATGDLICQWDDDDFCLPHRLATQTSRLLSSGCRVSYLGDQLHFYFPTGELFWEDWVAYGSGNQKRYALIPGTLLAYREGLPQYPQLGPQSRAGEDTVFADRALALDPGSVTVISGLGAMHTYSYHGVNQVYDSEHHRYLSRNRSYPRAKVLEHRSQIEEVIDYMDFPGPVSVMANDGLVFRYG